MAAPTCVVKVRSPAPPTRVGMTDARGHHHFGTVNVTPADCRPPVGNPSVVGGLGHGYRMWSASVSRRGGGAQGLLL